MDSKLFKQALEVINLFRAHGKAHLTTSNNVFDGKYIDIENLGELLNFSICDYLGLSVDKRLKQGSIRAVNTYGTYTAISRTFLKLNIYREAEELVSRIFGKPVLLLPRTTLSHITVLPILIGRHDAVILDHQVHTTVRIASDMLRAYGIHTETIHHNDLIALEEKYTALSDQYEKIWYFTDGVYSMFGDTIPAKELEEMLNRLSKLYLFVDDAHGMSWTGKNGSGYLLSQIDYHDKMFLITSLGKGFGAGGSAIVCPNEEIREKILVLGVPLMFTSPVEPATLGAIIESAKIHLSNEIVERQEQLAELVRYFYALAEELDLPVVDYTPTPIAMVATGKPELVNEISSVLFENKIHVTGAIYPAVPYNNSGLRITLTLYQTKKDVDKILHVLAKAFQETYAKKGLSNEQILKHYKLRNRVMAK
ncbi:aminotransferase class I/II-fold pyridoxal phosphate-dependent enzyme [Candidatus Sulfidibacterium hydrothermale]|uniref:aminotransferase class I/II-fold pyridoxal phosphate-dependent enzyme n=1 Tax=Candidatus Sulfidibacterium hydrothermale TaxID=2875962 RepID=UPI001F0A835B|nr:aminotransferase class I/II-fold pyridoxal phosphate-dependent enzyme [Candidatus Sulfidibacterium hydrothermale]UBM62044.1 aminotransferase class I/II-fold pyridoxal phosphate-dependent enzyme [Candidatus Sulfidibacterium hydrothermale]